MGSEKGVFLTKEGPLSSSKRVSVGVGSFGPSGSTILGTLVPPRTLLSGPVVEREGPGTGSYPDETSVCRWLHRPGLHVGTGDHR